MRCSECLFFRGTDGACKNPKSRQALVGYFQEAGPCFTAKDKPEQPKAEKTMAEETIKTRVCADCGQELPIERFARNRSGYTKYCKECMKVRRGKGNHGGGDYRLHETPLAPGISSLSDSLLIEELKKRGYTGKLTKIIEVEV